MSLMKRKIVKMTRSTKTMPGMGRHEKCTFLDDNTKMFMSHKKITKNHKKRCVCAMCMRAVFLAGSSKKHYWYPQKRRVMFIYIYIHFFVHVQSHALLHMYSFLRLDYGVYKIEYGRFGPWCETSKSTTHK